MLPLTTPSRAATAIYLEQLSQSERLSLCGGERPVHCGMPRFSAGAGGGVCTGGPTLEGNKE